jgi:alpha-glucosidase (family GH31 glycosyl hydrolase)
VRDVIKLRLSLLPYTYTAFARYQFEGVPPIRPMILEPGYLYEEKVEKGKLDGEKNPYAVAVRRDVTDQYMFGDCMLVAPMLTGQKSRKVILPQGQWYDFYTGKAVGGGEIIEVSPPLSVIPLFVREGGIIPMVSGVSRVSQMPADTPVEVRHYGRKPSSVRLYDDDGKTFDYEKSNYCWYTLEAKSGPDGKLVGAKPKREGKYASGYKNFTWRFMTK